MTTCPKCGAPAGPSAPDGDFRYRPPVTRDGAEAERSRIVALLREPDIDRRIAQATYYMPSSYTRAVCAALADLIESQQQGGGE